MIIGNHKDKVIQNIQNAAKRGNFHCKVEVNDPVLSAVQKKELLENYLKNKDSFRYKMNNSIAGVIANVVSRKENRITEFTGLKNIKSVAGGAIITSNHFNPLDNTIVREMVRRNGRNKLVIVCQETNLAMSGIVGYMMNYTDIIPISSDLGYMSHQFIKMMKEQLDKKNDILIYPEQEMWFNYRKPRPLKRGAYYYAAKLNVPILSCFVEIRTLSRKETEAFYRVKYIMHILPPIYPEKGKSVRENSIAMCQKDYLQKKAAYEKAYGKKLTYDFETEDIAGWILTKK